MKYLHHTRTNVAESMVAPPLSVSVLLLHYRWRNYHSPLTRNHRWRFSSARFSSQKCILSSPQESQHGGGSGCPRSSACVFHLGGSYILHRLGQSSRFQEAQMNTRNPDMSPMLSLFWTVAVRTPTSWTSSRLLPELDPRAYTRLIDTASVDVPRV